MLVVDLPDVVLIPAHCPSRHFEYCEEFVVEGLLFAELANVIGYSISPLLNEFLGFPLDYWPNGAHAFVRLAVSRLSCEQESRAKQDAIRHGIFIRIGNRKRGACHWTSIP